MVTFKEIKENEKIKSEKLDSPRKHKKRRNICKDIVMVKTP